MTSHAGEVDLQAIAHELYAVEPEQFTAVRDECATQAQRAGDSALAKAIKQLRRPTTAAWLVNQLAREQPARIVELIEIGASLREAQANHAGEVLRELDSARRDRLAALVQLASQLVRDRGRVASASVMAEVSRTLEAAVADPEAGAAVRTGLLARALAYSGFGVADLTEAVALPVRRATTKPRKAAVPSNRSAEAPATSGKVESAQAAAVASRRAVRELEERQEGLQRQIAALETHLASLKKDAATAHSLLRTARNELAAATKRLERSQRRAASGGPDS